MEQDKLQPVGPRVLIKPYESATTSASGLIMENTSNASAAPVRGTVIAAGKWGLFTKGSRFKKGQEILFRRYSTDRLVVITPDGEKEVMLVEDIDILAVVKN